MTSRRSSSSRSRRRSSSSSLQHEHSSSKRSSTKPEIADHGILANILHRNLLGQIASNPLLTLARILALCLVIGSPWYFGSAEWIAQYYLVVGAIAVCFVLMVHFASSLLRRSGHLHSSSNHAIPLTAIASLTLATFAVLQSIAWAPANPSNPSISDWLPNSIRLQRWALNTENVSLDLPFTQGLVRSTKDANLTSDASQPAISQATKERIFTPDYSQQPPWFKDGHLAISVEPLHTRAAVGGIAIVGLLIWLGCIGFSNPLWQVILLGTCSAMGVIIGLAGLAHIVSWNGENWLGLSSFSSFASFVSKNTAGGYLNVALAASIGLASWAFTYRSRRSSIIPYEEFSYPNSTYGFQSIFANLNSLRLSTVLITTFILASIFSTSSRGAIIGATVACLTVLIISGRQVGRRGSWIFAGVVIALGLALIFFFEIDARISKRFEDLSDMESHSSSGRTYIWMVAMKAFWFFQSTGSGLGTFHFAHLPFQNPTSPGWYYHAESLYAQALVELGWLGLAFVLLWWANITIVLKKLAATLSNRLKLKRHDRKGAFEISPAYMTGLVLFISQGIHSFVDFALIVPSVFIPAALIWGMILGVAKHRSIHTPDSKESDASRPQREIIARQKSRNMAARRIQWVGLLTSLFITSLLISSLVPIESMSIARRMERWLVEQEKIELEKRFEKPSKHLSSIWGDGPILSMYGSINYVSDALRFMGNGLFYEYRSSRAEELQNTSKAPIKMLFEETSPLLLRMAILKLQLDDSLEKVDTILGSPKQFLRWNKALEIYERAQLQSPLDWRIASQRLLLRFDIPVSDLHSMLQVQSTISQHRPEMLLPIAAIAKTADNNVLYNYLLRRMLTVSPGLSSRIATIIALDTPDEDVPVELFPLSVDALKAIANSPFSKTKFPITHEKIWNQIAEAASKLPSKDPSKEIWLANIEEARDELNEEIKHLSLAVRSNPTDRELRWRYIDRLVKANELETANRQAESAASLWPSDTRFSNFLKQIKEKSKTVEP